MKPGLMGWISSICLVRVLKMLNNLDPPWQWNYGQFTTSLGWIASKIDMCSGPGKAVR